MGAEPHRLQGIGGKDGGKEVLRPEPFHFLKQPQRRELVPIPLPDLAALLGCPVWPSQGTHDSHRAGAQEKCLGEEGW